MTTSGEVTNNGTNESISKDDESGAYACTAQESYFYEKISEIQKLKKTRILSECTIPTARCLCKSIQGWNFIIGRLRAIDLGYYK